MDLKRTEKWGDKMMKLILCPVLKLIHEKSCSQPMSQVIISTYRLLRMLKDDHVQPLKN